MEFNLITFQITNSILVFIEGRLDFAFCAQKILLNMRGTIYAVKLA